MESENDTATSGSDVPFASTTSTFLIEADTSVLTLLSNESARSILCAANDPSTAKELAEQCGLPLSTVYRKLDQLVNTSLIEETTRVAGYGKHPQQYTLLHVRD
ncbi:MAG: helix-turn-helix domain-containing protein [Haloplanus sp.]